MKILRLLLPGITLIFMLQASLTSAQQLPDVACPEYFEYLGFNQEYVGRISIRHDPQVQDNILRVEFSQPGMLSSSYVGTLTLWDDDKTTNYNIRSGNPIRYRVDFPTPGVLPKLTQLRINNVALCQASPYLPPTVTLSFSHSLRTTGPLFSQIPQSPQYVQQTQRRLVQQPQRPQEPFVEPQPEQRPILPSLAPTRPPAPASRPTPIATARPRPTAPAPQTAGVFDRLNGICGREKAVTSPLIFHGVQVARGQLPWMVALFERVEDGISFFCGGTLVSASTVLSAAHCFRYGSRDLPASRAAVSLGRNTLDLVSPGVLRQVSLLVIHDQYSSDNYTDADIALLRLASPVSFGDFIKPICLWSEEYLLQLPSGHKSYVSGWGADEHGNANTRIAKMTDTDIVTETECLRTLKSIESTSRVTARTICASNKQGAGPCSGDSGGGLMLQEGDVWLLRGVVSAGQRLANRCDLTQPVIYTDLARHIDWLRVNIWF